MDVIVLNPPPPSSIAPPPPQPTLFSLSQTILPQPTPMPLIKKLTQIIFLIIWWRFSCENKKIVWVGVGSIEKVGRTVNWKVVILHMELKSLSIQTPRKKFHFSWSLDYDNKKYFSCLSPNYFIMKLWTQIFNLR